MPLGPFHRLSALTVIALSSLAVSAPSAAADPTPFATASSGCGNITFPVQSAAHQNVIYSVTSFGAQGYVFGGYGNGTEAFSPGDEVWGPTTAVQAGTAPTLYVSCSSGSVQASLYDLPNAPVTYTGASDNAGTSSTLPFNALGSGQYVLNATIDQGAITVGNTTIASSGQYPLGSLNGGINDLYVQGVSGPAAQYTLSVSEVPVQISNLSFGTAQYASVGTILTGSFSVSGDTTIDAYVHNAAGQVVRQLGSFAVNQGNSSLTWDARGNGGTALPDGLYYLHLDSTDPNGNVTSAEAPITVDSTPPSAAMISPATISPSQAVTFSLGDTGSGLQSASLYIDGQDVADYGGYGSYGYYGQSVPSTFSYDGGYAWTLGTHTWEIKSSDNAGNQGDQTGTFTVATPPPPPPPPKLTGPAATAAFGSWLRVRYGAGLSNYWVCPQAQVAGGEVSCIAEFRIGRQWHMVWAQAKYYRHTLQITSSSVTTWKCKWSKYSKHVIAGFSTPGEAQTNSPAFDWAFLAAGAYYQHQHHKRSFTDYDYDGMGSGYGRFFQFSCQTHGKIIRCSNTFGDSIKYRP